MYIREDLTHLTDSDELTLRHVVVSDIDNQIDRMYGAIKEFIDSKNQNITYTNGCISINIGSVVEVVGVNVIPHTGFIFAFWIHEEKASGAVKTAVSLAKLSPIKVAIKVENALDNTISIESIQFADEGVKR